MSSRGPTPADAGRRQHPPLCRRRAEPVPRGGEGLDGVGAERVAAGGLPWVSSTAFLRIVTNPRALRDPLEPAGAWGIVDAWLDAPAVWVPIPGRGHREILGRLVRELDLRGNLVSDAMLAALCIEHGLEMISADSDFARFGEITWQNPMAG